MQQLSLTSADDRTPWEHLLRAIGDAVYHLGLKEVVFKLNAAKSTVSQALKLRDDDDDDRRPGKDERHWRQEWTLTVLEMLADRYNETSNQHAKAILDAQAAMTRRFGIVALEDEPSDEEIAAAERVFARIKRRRKRAA